MKNLIQKIISSIIVVSTATIVVICPQVVTGIYANQVTSYGFSQKSTADDNASGDLFGYSVAVTGKYALIGSAYNDDKGLTDSGSAYLFDLTTGKQLRKLTAKDNAAGDLFGYSAAVTGKYALIGSAYDDDKGLADSGSAYLFDITTGKQLQKFIANDDAAGDRFGEGVAVAGKYAIVGSPYDDDKGLIDSGAAYLFDIATGRQLEKFLASDGTSEDRFGNSVAVAGKYAIVGSAYDDDKGLIDSGSAYLFNITTGKQIQKFIANDDAAGDRFGEGVAVAGKYVLVGSPYDDNKGLVDSGSAYLFDIATGKQIRKFTANDNAAGDLFGGRVVVTSKYALISSVYDDDKGLLDSGSAYLFDIATGKQLQKFIANDDAAEDRFGDSIAVAGKYVLVGSPYDDDKGLIDNGSAYLFDMTTGRQLEKF